CLFLVERLGDFADLVCVAIQIAVGELSFEVADSRLGRRDLGFELLDFAIRELALPFLSWRGPARSVSDRSSYFFNLRSHTLPARLRRPQQFVRVIVPVHDLHLPVLEDDQ